MVTRSCLIFLTLDVLTLLLMVVGLTFKEVATEKEQTSEKKGSSEIKFRVKTKEDVYMFRVEVYPNGSVTINVTPVNKQAITFYGDVALDLK
jgi:uncharacterized protein YpmS